MIAVLRGPGVLTMIMLIVGLVAVAIRIGSVERRQRIRREQRAERQAQAQWEAMQRNLSPSWQRTRR